MRKIATRLTARIKQKFPKPPKNAARNHGKNNTKANENTNRQPGILVKNIPTDTPNFLQHFPLHDFLRASTRRYRGGPRGRSRNVDTFLHLETVHCVLATHTYTHAHTYVRLAPHTCCHAKQAYMLHRAFFRPGLSVSAKRGNLCDIRIA